MEETVIAGGGKNGTVEEDGVGSEARQATSSVEQQVTEISCCWGVISTFSSISANDTVPLAVTKAHLAASLAEVRME